MLKFSVALVTALLVASCIGAANHHTFHAVNTAILHLGS